MRGRVVPGARGRPRLEENHGLGRGAQRDLRVTGIEVPGAVVDRHGGGDANLVAGRRRAREVRRPVDGRVIEPGVGGVGACGLSPTNATWRTVPLATTEGWSNTHAAGPAPLSFTGKIPSAHADAARPAAAAITSRKRLRTPVIECLRGGSSTALLDAPESPLYLICHANADGVDRPDGPAGIRGRAHVEIRRLHIHQIPDKGPGVQILQERGDASRSGSRS